MADEPNLSSPFLRALDAEMKAAYRDVLNDQLREMSWLAVPPAPPPGLRTRAWRRITRRPRRIAVRLSETWGVLRRGLPEGDW